MGAALICTGRRTDDVTNLMDALRYNANAPQNYNEVTGLAAQKKKKKDVFRYKMFIAFIRDGTLHK
jgi:hypothetical protein